MDINQIIMYIFSIGVIVGGVDYLIGDKWGFGDRFQEAFRLLAPTAFNMVGIICLTPSIAWVLQRLVAPAFHFLGLDPGTVGSVLALDMGGYPLAMSLADDPAFGAYAGIVVGACMGCTLVFTIPVGMALIKKEYADDFLQGLVIGLITMPVGLIVGGLAAGFSVLYLLKQLLPILILAAVLIFGLLKFPERMIAIFRRFSQGLTYVIRFGLVLAALLYFLNIQTPYVTPINVAMETVSMVCLVLLGSLPFALMVQRGLKKPLIALGSKLDLDETAVAAFLICLVSTVPVFTMVNDMKQRGRVVIGAYIVCSAGFVGAHLAYCAANAPEMTGALLAGKGTGMIAAVLLALWFLGQRKKG